MNRNLNNGLDSCKEKLEVKNYCSMDIAKINTQQGILARNFSVGELSSVGKTNLHIRAYVDHYGGYAEHARNILFGLENTGRFNIRVTPIKSIIDVDPITLQKINHFICNPAFKNENSIFLGIAGPGWFQEKFLPKEAKYKIAWTMIESVSCHEKMKEWLKNVDEIWAPTNCDLERFNCLGLKNVKVIRLGFDEKLYNPNVEPVKIVQLKGKFVFGVLGSWNRRKNVGKIVRAYCKAFKGMDNVCLLLVSKYSMRPYGGIKYGEEVKKEDLSKWDMRYEFDLFTKDLVNLPSVCVIDVPIHENVMPNILANFNCLVGFSMGESTWLPGLQAAAMKIPIIQLAAPSNGFLDYLNKDNSYLIENYFLVDADDELVKGTSSYYENQKFFDGDENDLANTMFQVYLQRKEGFEKDIEQLCEYVLRCYTWDNSVLSVSNRLREINGNKNI